MQDMQKIQYNGKLVTKKGTVHYRKGAVQDAGQIARIYENVAIHRDNYQERLCKDGENSFEKKGGMFLVMTEAEIRRRLQDPSSFWAVMEDEKGIVIGCFWFLDSGRKGIAFPMEILASEAWSGNSIGRYLYDTSFCAMKDVGYKCSICEVYEVTGFQSMDGGGRGKGREQACLLNGPSYHVLTEIGGIEFEMGDEKQIVLEELRVWVRPHRFLCWHEESIRLTRRRRG